MRGDQSAAVELDLAVLTDDAELDGEPEEASHALQLVLRRAAGAIGKAGADLAVVLQEVGEDRMGVHGHVPEDVMEDVGLGGVFERVAAAQPGGSGKLARGEHLEEGVGRQEAADGRGVPAGAWTEALVDLGEIGDGVFAQANLFEAVEIFLAGVLAELRHAAAHEFSPDSVLLGCVSRPVLLDEVGFGDGERSGLRVHEKFDSGKTF